MDALRGGGGGGGGMGAAGVTDGGIGTGGKPASAYWPEVSMLGHVLDGSVNGKDAYGGGIDTS